MEVQLVLVNSKSSGLEVLFRNISSSYYREEDIRKKYEIPPPPSPQNDHYPFLSCQTYVLGM